jgi:retron-type reverse transcriptase
MHSEIYDFANLYDSYLKARRIKRYRGEVLQFSANVETELIALQTELVRKTYAVSKYRQRVIYEPKKRQIVSLPFRDRVVQHALNNIIEPVFDRRMIDDSYACRVGGGTDRAVKRLSYFMGKQNTDYYLKIDIKSFFASVNKDILKDIIRRHITDQSILWLIDTILDSSPVPGIPIGNLMSQLFANVLLHEADHHCKNVMGIKFYVRYMDDIIILGSSKSYLKAILEDIRYFLTTSLELTLNPKTGVGRCKDGIEFVGFRVWRNLRMIKKQSLARMKKKLHAFKNDRISSKKFMASLGSWMGHSVNTSSYRGVMRIALDSIHEMSRRAASNGL